MTSLPVSGYFVNPARTNGEAKAAWDDMTDFTREGPGGSPIAEVTIDSGGAIAPTRGIHSVDTYLDASSDNLDNIGQATLVDGRQLILRAENDARTVVLRHAQGGAGQIVLSDGASFSLDDTKKWIYLFRNGTSWEEVGRFYGNDPTSFAAFYDVMPNPFTTRGDLLVQGASAATRIGVGASGEFLGSDGVDPLWTPAAIVGEIRMYGTTGAPTKWLACDGAEVSRSTYSALFGVIGTTWGNGNGTTTFNVPDLRGRSVIGAGQGNTAEGGGLGTNRTVGTLGGAEEHTQASDEVGQHTHGVPRGGDQSSGTGYRSGAAQWSRGSQTTDNISAPNPMNNMHPFGVATYIIFANA